MTQNTMTPPEHVVAQMIEQAFGPLGPAGLGNSEQLLKAFVMFAGAAAQWGADQELEACCALLELSDNNARDFLQSTRRPKSSSLKEQALEALASADGADHPIVATVITADQHALIRRALESLPD